MSNESALHVLPVRTGGAAENMAADFLLLQRYPAAEAARFRHYGWRSQAFTFGFGQKIGWVRANLPDEGPFDVCRRPTGGGIVDHRNDWTYALVVPRGHALYDERAVESYRIVHECLAKTMSAFGQPAELKRECEPCEDGPTVCFERAERFDVIVPGAGRKIAGAAQKRNKHGLLFQGSIERQAVGPDFDWERFGAEFPDEIGRALGIGAREEPWPEFNEDEVGGLTDQYSSPEWLDYR